MPGNTYRGLSPAEIRTLETQGCQCGDWSRVQVAEGFRAERVRGVTFAGNIRLGLMDASLPSCDGAPRPSGIANARLTDVSVGDHCIIANVSGGLANLDIGDRVVMEGVGTVACTKESEFGNGHVISVLNEGGGRELPITVETGAQAAYLTVLYRDRRDLVAAMTKMAERLAAQVRSRRARIGAEARIMQCQEILNVAVGPHAVLSGVLSLKDGTVDSSAEAPTFVGAGVTAEHFIIQKGASVADGAMIASSLVGEAARIGKQFSAENSAFFANSEGFHSEACSVFAGPYTVTHHRSTLLIAALYSFFNAGSGTNQSNHMYKLGPLHQGIIERGCKTGSFSYLLWPCRVGAFTAVMGKHYANFDTSDFPFSYISEENGESTLIPGMNFFTVGTLRDGEKWPARDRRKSSRKLDWITFDVLSPFTAQKMIRGSRILMDLHDKSEKSHEYVTYNGIHIKRLLLKTCRRYYELALDKYFGDVVVSRIESRGARSVRDALGGQNPQADGRGEWVDLAGLICPRERLDRLIASIVAGHVATFDALNDALGKIHAAYRGDEWQWFLARYQEIHGRPLSEENPEALRDFIGQWKVSSVKLLNMVSNDAQKEFVGDVRIGFGIDGSADADFDAVRGTFDGNKFTRKLKGDIDAINRRFDAVCQAIA